MVWLVASTIPLVVLLSDTGEELGRIVGYRSPSAFLKELSNILILEVVNN
jgi:hypothetical protein